MRLIVTRVITHCGVENEYFVYNGTNTIRLFGVGLIGLKNQGHELYNVKIKNDQIIVDPLVPRTPDNLQVTPYFVQNEYGQLLAKLYNERRKQKRGN